MFRGSRRLVLVLVAIFAFAPGALVGGGGAASAASGTSFSGQATVLKGTVLGLPLDVVDTGPVDAGGGRLEANLLCYPTAPDCMLGAPDLTSGAVGATVLHAAVAAQGNTSRAEASVASFQLTNVAGNTITTGLLGAHATATCNGSTASVSAGADVAHLVVNGDAIDVTIPNQRIDLPLGGYVIANEQVGSASAGQGGVTVNALHVVIPGVADLVVAQAHADVLCGSAAGGCGSDKLTGGGFIAKDVNFAAAAEQGSTWGHLLFMDKPLGVKVKGTPATAALSGSKSGGSATFSGPAQGSGPNGTSVGWFVAKAVDNAEPGAGADTFTVALFDAQGGRRLYDSSVDVGSGVLQGGNVQYHSCK